MRQQLAGGAPALAVALRERDGCSPTYPSRAKRAAGTLRRHEPGSHACRDRRPDHRIGRRRHVCRDRGGARRLRHLPDRPQPDRPRRCHRHGADDRRGGARRRDAGPLEPPLRRHAGSRARAVRRAAGAAALRGRPRVHPADGSMGRRLGAQGWAHPPGFRARPRPAALRLCGFPQHRPGSLEDAAHRDRARNRHSQGR